MPVIDGVKKLKKDMTAWRRDIHAHPELGFKEERTAGIVAEKLTSFGIKIDRGMAKTGVVGTLSRGRCVSRINSTIRRVSADFASSCASTSAGRSARSTGGYSSTRSLVSRRFTDRVDASSASTPPCT